MNADSYAEFNPYLESPLAPIVPPSYAGEIPATADGTIRRACCRWIRDRHGARELPAGRAHEALSVHDLQWRRGAFDGPADSAPIPLAEYAEWSRSDEWSRWLHVARARVAESLRCADGSRVHVAERGGVLWDPEDAVQDAALAALERTKAAYAARVRAAVDRGKDADGTDETVTRALAMPRLERRHGHGAPVPPEAEERAYAYGTIRGTSLRAADRGYYGPRDRFAAVRHSVDGMADARAEEARARAELVAAVAALPSVVDTLAPVYRQAVGAWIAEGTMMGAAAAIGCSRKCLEARLIRAGRVLRRRCHELGLEMDAA